MTNALETIALGKRYRRRWAARRVHAVGPGGTRCWPGGPQRGRQDDPAAPRGRVNRTEYRHHLGSRGAPSVGPSATGARGLSGSRQPDLRPVDRGAASADGWMARVDPRGGQTPGVAVARRAGRKPRPTRPPEFLQTLMEVVAAQGVTVVLSSHLVADLERVCDHPLVLDSGSVALAGEVDALLASHRRLTGPRRVPTPV